VGSLVLILFYELTPSPAVPPHTVLTGDYFEVDQTAQQIKHKRGTATVATYGASSWPGENLGEFPPYKPFAGVFKVVYPKEKRMPGTNVALTNIRFGSGDAIIADFSNGNQRELPGGLPDLASVANTVDTNDSLAEDILLAMAYRSSPDGANLGAMIGAQVAINCANGVADPVVYTAP
jgi:hypothetical protein